MTRRWAWALLCTACACGAPAAEPPAERDAGTSPPAGVDAGDAGGPAVDAGGTPPPDAGTPVADAGADAGAAAPSSDGGQRLLLGSGEGQLFSYPFDPATGVPDADALVAYDFGAPLLSAVVRPGSDLLYAATQAAGASSSTLHVLRLGGDGALTLVSQASAGAKDVSLRFDPQGTWLLMSNGSSFRAAAIAADGAVGTVRSLVSCNASGISANPGGTAVYGTCNGDNTLKRFDFSPAAGPTQQRTQATFNGLRPIDVQPFGSKLLLFGGRQNGVSGSTNRLVLLAEGATSAESTLTLTPSTESSLTVPTATALAVHPRLQVAYALNGFSYAYGGMSLSVVGTTASGALEARQDVDAFASSGALGVSPEGRWLMVGSTGVSEVRRWSIDGATGKVSADTVIALINAPVFIGFH